MSVSESCGCGAGFSADRDDELRLLNEWRRAHSCRVPEGGSLSVESRVESVEDVVYPVLRVGFRGDEGD